MTTTPDRFRTIICQRCGHVFMLTDTYVDLLERKGARREQILESSDQALREGQTVRFHLYDARKGPEAFNVELIEA